MAFTTIEILEVEMSNSIPSILHSAFWLVLQEILKLATWLFILFI